MHRGLTPQDYRTLRLSPFWVLAAIVGKYRGFHPLEVEALRRVVAEAAGVADESVDGPVDGSMDELMDDVFGVVAADVASWLAEFETDGESVVGGLHAVDRVLSRLDSGTARAVKTVLVDQIGAGVARARGPFGQLMTQGDRDTLELLTGVLDIELLPQHGAAPTHR